MRAGLLAAALALAPLMAQAEGAPPEAAQLQGQHPSKYYETASQLFSQGRREDAVVLFYLGQLHWRCLLAANPGIDPTGDPALFGSLSEVVGRPLNEWAFGDPEMVHRLLGEVLSYDAAHPDPYRMTQAGSPECAQVRRGLEGLRDGIPAQAEAIRRERTRNGLPNR